MADVPIYIVFGSPRTGGNLTAGVLHHLGVSMGERFRVADDWNPAGWFEDLDFDAALREAVGPSETLRPVARSQALADLIAARNVGGDPWGWKHRHTPRVMEQLVAEHRANLRPIVTTRNFAESVDSYAARAGVHFDLEQTIQEVGRHRYVVEAAISHYGLKPLVVDFDDLIADPAGQVRRIADYAGLPVRQAAVDWVNPALKRFGSAKS